MVTVHRIGFTKLTHESIERDPPYLLNVIFVHGLRGHPQSTWEDEVEAGDVTPDRSATPSKRRLLNLPFRAKRSKPDAVDHVAQKNRPQPSKRIFWPRDYLVDDLPEARIWTYGYNADVIGGMFEANNQNSVSQHGQDLAIKFERDIDNQHPVVFVAHSLGGIVVKDALHRSNICRLRTKLVVFLGTPHRGSSYADWGTIASNLACLALQDSNKNILKTLQVNGEVLDIIHDEFQHIIQNGGIRIHSFQEARGLSGLKGLESKVVNDFSSKIGLVPPIETVESIDANHMQMAKCRTKDDPQYRAILGVLRQFIRTGLETNEAAASPPLSSLALRPMDDKSIRVSGVGESNKPARQPCYYIQLPKNPRFTGRTAILDALEDIFFAQKTFRKVAIAGLGGVGKTQIASQFVYRVKESRPDYAIFWVSLMSDGSAEQDYIKLAKKLGVQKSSDDEDIKELVCQHLSSNEAGKYLLVVDNADDPELVFGSGDKHGIKEYLPESENGLVLLTTRSRHVAVGLAESNIIDVEQMEREEAFQLFKDSLVHKQTLQDKALTMELLNRLTYLPLAITQAAAYLNQTMVPIHQYLGLLQGAEEDVVRVLGREFEDSTRYRNSQNAVATTWLVSFDQIQKSNPAAVTMLSFMSCIEPTAIPQSILPETNPEEQIWAIGTLCGYSFLVRRSNSDMFDMHSLVHLAARVWIEKQGKTRSILEKAICHLRQIFPSSHWSNRDIWRGYLPHAFCVLDRSKDYITEDRYSLVDSIGNCLGADRRFKEAIVCYEEVYNWKRERLPEDNASRLTSEYQLGIAYLDDRRIKEAIALLEHVVDIRKKTRDEKDHERLSSEQLLASAYLSNRQIGVAIKMFEHVVMIRKETLDEANTSRLTSEYELARAYLDNGQTEEAIEILKHVVTIQTETLDKKDNFRLTSQHELARAYLNDRRIKEAIGILEHMVMIQRETLDEKDHERLTSEQLLASAYLSDRQIDKAIKILEYVVTIRREILGAKDYSRQTSGNELARAYLDNRQIDEAIKILEFVVVIRKETLDEKDHGQLTSEHELARAYLNDGRVKDAIEILEHVVMIRKKTRDEKYHERLTSEQLLASAYIFDGQVDKAIKILEHVETIRRETLDKKDYYRMSTEHELARAYLDNRQIDQATEILEHVVAIQKETLKVEDNSRLWSEHELARAYLTNKRIEEAIEILEHVVMMRQRMLDEKDHDRLTSEQLLAGAYLAGNQAQKSIDLLEHVVAMERQLFEDGDSNRETSLHLLREAYLLLEAERKATDAESDQTE